MRGLIRLGRLRLNQQKRVVELNVGIAELESIELALVLPVGRSEEISAARAFDDGLFQHATSLQSWQVEIAQRVFPKRHCPDGRLVVLPVELLQLGPQMDGRPCGDDKFVLHADALDLTAKRRSLVFSGNASTVGFGSVGECCDGA